MKENESKTRKWYRQNPRETDCKQFLLSIEEDVYENLREYAFQNGHSINSMIGKLIKNALRSESGAKGKMTKPRATPGNGNRRKEVLSGT